MGFPRILLICGLVYSAHAGIFKDAQKFGEDFIKVIKDCSRRGGGGSGLVGWSINFLFSPLPLKKCLNYVFLFHKMKMGINNSREAEFKGCSNMIGST